MCFLHPGIEFLGIHLPQLLAVDFKSAVEELHGRSSQELGRLLKESETFTIQVNAEKGSLLQIDMERLSWSLPLHLIAVLVSPGGDDTRMRYLLRGVRLLHSLCDLASRHMRLEQILLEEVKVTEQILDLVFYVVIVLARYEQESHVESSLPVLHSALVVCSLHLLTGYVSSQWQDLVHVLLVHPKVDVFMDVAFDAVRVGILFFQMKLSRLNNEVSYKKCSLLSAERTTLNLCQQCEASLQFLQSLCQQKVFRERLLKNKELCRNGSILSLAAAILKLKIPLNFKESTTITAAVSRWKSKVLSILLQLCETESISYLDEVASSPRSMHLAKSVALEVLELLKAAFSRESKQRSNRLDKNNPKGLVILNSMRLADIFSDDSNFRSFIMANITQVLADILALPYEEFLSNWCSTDLPVMEEDATLEYDPFTAAGAVLVSLTGGFGIAPPASNPLNETNVACPFVLNSTAPVSHAQQRTSFLVKIIANLHCFVPNICEEQEKDQFFNKFLECLEVEPPKSSSRFVFSSDAQKASTICKNLRSLLDHAVSLIPNFLNEEDVQLLSVFFEQLQALIPPARFEENPIQEPAVQDVRNTHENKFRNPFTDSQNSSLCWDRFPSVFLGQRHQETQNTAGRVPPPTRSVEEGDLKEGISENSMFQEVDQFRPTSKHMDLPDDLVEMDRNRRKEKIQSSRRASGSLREIDKDMRKFERSGSDVSPMKGKNCFDQNLENGEFRNLAEHAKDSGFRDVQENERLEAGHNDERQPRKRKRNIMNEKQTALIERALLDEPEMQRNASSLQSWADKLSVHGSELTSSQLKNWLNNRKAKLARVAREARAPSEGESPFPDKACGSGRGPFYDSPESAGEDSYIPLTTARGSNQSTSKFGVVARTASGEASEMPSLGLVDFAPQQGIQINYAAVRYVRCDPGQYVSLIDGEGKEVGKGKVYQVEGRWHGKSLEEAGICVVDVIELKAERWSRVPHPLEAAGITFDEAETKNGVMRVAWDANKIFLLSQ
ncbi:nodulin homeobox isoform X3 [Magnolia sinica]|uniref:nodulin homeobox isoform X3 n=1 Tax=Magnolia sinica TaxID=86752 RepID=UPI00265919C4|nr:nodulin homeobox isoform X3 [Magnolia sinica]